MKHITTLLLFTLLTYGIKAQSYPVGVRTVTYTDASRSNRSIPVEVHYPATSTGSNTALANDSFPFVVFGHGFQMTASAYYPFADSLAQRGYIVAFANTESSLSPSHPDFAKDLIFIYNTLITEQSNSASPFYQHVIAKGAIAGHSMGGGCTVLSAQYGNPAVCYFTMAEANTTPSSITAASSMTKPYLSFAGSYDCIAPYTANQQPTYDSSGSPCKILIDITGASHCQFGLGNFQCNFGEGFSGCANPPLSRTAQINTVLGYIEPYLDYYLKGICRSWTSFDSVYNADAVNTKTRNCTNTVPSNPNITGAASFCTGSSTELRALPYGFIYHWSNGLTTDSISVSAAGSYTVTVSNGTCSLTSPPVSETLLTAPTVPAAISGLDSLCSGSTNVIYSVPSVTGVTSYNWTIPSGWTLNSVAGTNTINITVSSTPGSISVNETNSCGTGVSISKAIVLDSLPHLSGTISGADTVCIGSANQVYTFSGSNDGSLIWSAPAAYSISSGQGTTTLHLSGVDTSGTITLISSGTCGQSLPLTFKITVIDTPHLTGTISGADTICLGHPDQVYTFTGSNAGTLHWSVSSPYSITSGQSSNTVHISGVNSSGSVTLISGVVCAQSAPLSFQITAIDTPHLSGTISGADTICVGHPDQVYTFTGTSVGTLLWSATTPFSISSGQATNTINLTGVDSSGIVTLSSSGRCGQSAPVSLQIAVVDTPHPSVIQSGDTLQSSVLGSAYQWYLNGQAINNANGSTYIPTANGSYTVKVINGNGCAGLSSGLSYVNVGIDPIGTDHITVYPNPADDIIYIRADQEIMEISLIDNLGRKVATKSAPTDNLDVAGIATGIYIVQVVTKDNRSIFFKINKR